MGTHPDAAKHAGQFRGDVELGSSEPLDQLRGLRATDPQLLVPQRHTIGWARERGASWAEIGAALGMMTTLTVWAQYNQDVRETFDAVRERSVTLPETGIQASPVSVTARET